MSDEKPSELAFSGIDLASSILPDWAKSSSAPAAVAKLAERYDRGDDHSRGGGQRRDGRSGPRRPDDRRPAGGPRGGGRDRRDGDKRRDPRRDDRRGDRRDDRRDDRRPEPPPVLTGWSASVVPDHRGIDGLAKQIRSSGKAYPLFDLAVLILEQPERYQIALRRESDQAPTLFQVNLDGSLWTSEKEAVAHLLARHLDKFYRCDRITIDPPKGSFSCVAVCGDIVLGPPNHHAYQSRLREVHAARFRNMPFEAFKGRVQMVKDPEFIEKWKTEQSSKDQYFPRGESDETEPAELPEPAAPEPVAVEEAPEVTAESLPAAEPVAVEEGAEPVAEAALAEAAEPQTPEKPQTDALADMAAVEIHFRATHAASTISPIQGSVEVSGAVVAAASSPSLRQLALNAVNDLRRFPLPLAHVIGQNFAAAGLQIFKAHENITYVSVARPRYLDRTAAPVAEGLSTILDYLEGKPAPARPDQWKALLAMRTAPEDLAARESALASDLAWLIHQGHVMDYAKRGLEAVRKPKPPREHVPKKKHAPAAPAVAAVPVEPLAEA